MKSVTIYTSSDCGYCHEAKVFLNENKIQYTERNISEDKEARKEIMKKGYRSVPIIIVDDKEMIGFDKSTLAMLLSI